MPWLLNMEREKSKKQRRNRSGIIGTIFLGIIGLFGGVFQDFTSAILEPILIPLESKWARIIQSYIPQEEELSELDIKIPSNISIPESLAVDGSSTLQTAVEEERALDQFDGAQQSLDGKETTPGPNQAVVNPAEQSTAAIGVGTLYDVDGIIELRDSPKGEIIIRLDSGTQVDILESNRRYSIVRTSSGIVGHVSNSRLNQ